MLDFVVKHSELFCRSTPVWTREPVFFFFVASEVVSVLEKRGKDKGTKRGFSAAWRSYSPCDKLHLFSPLSPWWCPVHELQGSLNTKWSRTKRQQYMKFLFFPFRPTELKNKENILNITHNLQKKKTFGFLKYHVSVKKYFSLTHAREPAQ